MNATPEPIWIRLPKAGTHCRYTGNSRSSLHALAVSGKVDSRKIHPTGGSRGVLLIRLESLLEYIERGENRVEEERNLPTTKPDLLTVPTLGQGGSES